MSELRLVKAINDMWTSNLNQALGLELLGRLDDLLPERTELLCEHMEFAVARLAEHVPDWTVVAPPGGMVIWTELPISVARQFAHHAAAHGVMVAGDDAFAVDGTAANRIRIPFTEPQDVLADGIARLGDAWRTLDPTASILAADTRRAFI